MTTKKQRQKPRKQWARKPKYRTLAEGFAAAAEEKQRKLDMHSKVAESLRTTRMGGKAD